MRTLTESFSGISSHSQVKVIVADNHDDVACLGHRVILSISHTKAPVDRANPGRCEPAVIPERNVTDIIEPSDRPNHADFSDRGVQVGFGVVKGYRSRDVQCDRHLAGRRFRRGNRGRRIRRQPAFSPAAAAGAPDLSQTTRGSGAGYDREHETPDD